MKKSCFNMWLLLLLLQVAVRAQDFEWVKQFSVPGSIPPFQASNYSVTANRITTDKQGNVFVSGYFSGTIDFDPGPGTSTLSSNGVSNCFLCKLDSTGALIWAQNLSPGIGISGTVVDKYGNLFVAGSFDGIVDMDPGPATYSINNAFSTYILKLDPTGNFIWVKPFLMSGPGQIVCTSVALDSTLNIYTSGYIIGGPADFDPDTSSYFLSSAPQQSMALSNSLYKPFLSKLDSNGTFVFAKITTDNYYGIGNITVNPAGEAFMAGSASPFPYSSTTAKWFFTKYNTNGNIAWSKLINGNNVSINSTALDRDNNFYVIGGLYDTYDFDPGAGTFSLGPNSNALASMYILRLDSGGNFIQAQKISDGYASVFASQILTDAAGNIYISGNFKGTVDFAPNIGQTFNLMSASYSGFILKLDKFGEFAWVKQVGENSMSMARSISLDNFGNLYSVGNFSGTVDFDPGIGTYNLTGLNNSDAFIHKLSGPVITGIAEQVAGPDITAFPNPTGGIVH